MDANKTIELAGTISCNITHVHGKLIFKHNKKWSRAFYSICGYYGEGKDTPSIYAISPEDYKRGLMVTTIKVTPSLSYCDKARTCLDFKCKFNRFNKQEYIDQFGGDFNVFTLGLPHNFNNETPLWFNEGKWREVWKKYVISPEGGYLIFNKDAT